MTGIIQTIASFTVPAILIVIIGFGLCSNIKVFDVFIKGAKDGLDSMAGILPNLIGLLAAVAVFKASGGLDFLTGLIRPATSLIGIIPETVPLALLRPISGSASLAFLSDIFKNFSPDSLIGQTASVMMGSTETILYTVAVYLGGVGVSNSKFAIPVALCVDLMAFFIAALLCGMLF